MGSLLSFIKGKALNDKLETLPRQPVSHRDRCHVCDILA